MFKYLEIFRNNNHLIKYNYYIIKLITINELIIKLNFLKFKFKYGRIAQCLFESKLRG